MVRKDVVKLLKTETIEVLVLALAYMHPEVTAITFSLKLLIRTPELGHS